MGYTPLKDTIFKGNPRVPTALPGDNDTTAASTAFVTAATAFYVPLAGGVTVTGDLTFGTNADIVMDNTSVLTIGDVTISRVAADALTLASGDQIRVQQDPVNGNDLVRKSYVDNVASGLDTKASVWATTTGAITLSGLGTQANGDWTSSLTAGDRILVKNQASPIDNGIYVAASGGWTRATDFDGTPSGEVSGGAYTFVETGAAHGDTGWVVISDGVRAVGTDDIVFTQFSNAIIVSTLESLTDVDTAGVVDGAILRYEADTSVWADTSALLFDDNGQLKVTTTGSSAGIMLGGDAQLYRSAADVLATPDSFLIEADSGKDTLAISATGTDVGLTIGGDTNLYRSAVNTLKTDDSLVVAGKSVMEAGQRVAVSAVKTANYTAVLASDYVIRTDSTSGAINIALPAGHAAGDTLVIKDVAGTAEANNVTIDPNGAETIDGAANFVIDVNYQAVTVVSNGTNWFIV